MIILTRPTLELKEQALAYRQEHFDKGERIINGSELFDQIESYEEWLLSVTNNGSPETVNPAWVVTDTFFAIQEETGNIVGIIDFRHTLNDFLADFGHCGYSVRPSERNKGFATEMLKQIISLARKTGLSKLQLSVERSNTPSIKTIEKNGGVCVRSFIYEGEEADIYDVIL